jgi:hypothetical protein
MMNRKWLLTAVLAALLVAGTACAQPAPAAPAAGTVVLDAAGVWRFYQTLRPPILLTADGQKDELMMNVKWLDWETQPVAQGWTAADFNDRTWTRGPARRSARTPYVSQLCLRGKFEVTDPAKAGDLTATLEFHGGVIVYMNGKEIGRKHLPEGAVTADTLAEAYGDDAFVDAQGNLIEGGGRGPAAPASRVRTATFTVPANALRKGVNVLAVEVIRSGYPKMLEDKHPRGVGGQSKDPGLMWNTCEIRKVTLTAKGADGLVPNATRPKGFQVWNGDTLAGDVSADYGDRTEPLLPATILSPRNGQLYAKVLLGCDQPIKGLKVVAGALQGPDAAIPAANIAFRYAVPGGSEIIGNDPPSPYPNGAKWLGALLEEPLPEFPEPIRGRDGASQPGGAAVVPLWIRVKVPATAAPGLYKGAVTVSAEGQKPVAVPVEVTVLPWTAPSPENFRTWVELVQSPDTLAVEYKVPLWSPQHFDLIARSFRLVRDTGARSVYISAIAHTNLGNEESMIRWIKKPDGTYDWDFSVMDRYLDAATKNQGTPRAVILQVWEVYMNTIDSTGRRFGEVLQKNQETTGGAPLVTFVDANGKTENGTIPKLSDPASKAIWQALINKVRENLKKRGLEGRLYYGMFTDSIPNKADTKFFLDIGPEITWVQQGHNAFTDLNGIAKVGYTATWWSNRFADDLVNQRSGSVRGGQPRGKPAEMTSMFGWNKGRQDAYYPRMTNEQHPVSYWRFLCESAITGDFYCGIGRVGADYWTAVKNREGRRVGWVNERFVEVAGYLHSLHSYLLEPQEKQQVAMTRLPNLEEGIQESEARIVIEDALVNLKLAEKDPALAKRAKELLDERLMYMYKGMNNQIFGGWGVSAWRFQAGPSGHAWLLQTENAKRTAELYKLAGEVEKALGK